MEGVVKSKPLTFDVQRYLHQSTTRSKGLHLSAIIRDLYQSMYPGEWSDAVDDATRLRWELGFMWETVFARVFGERATGHLQKELLKDGVWMTPDHVLPKRVEEYKVTWKSAAKWPDDRTFWAWRVQLMAYCHATGHTVGRLIPFFVNGDYRNSGPQVLPVEYTFSQMDLARNWRTLMEHRKRMERAK